MRSLRNEASGSARATWANVDKAASRVPEWAKDHISKVAAAKVNSIGTSDSVNEDRKSSR